MADNPDDPESQAVRRATLENDRKVREANAARLREQAGTFLSHTHADTAGGRFAAAEAQTVIGRDSAPHYPQLPASSPWGGEDLVGPEPPLGFSVDEMPSLEPLPLPDTAQATDEPASDGDAPSEAPLADVQRADDVGSPSSDGGSDAA